MKSVISISALGGAVLALVIVLSSQGAAQSTPSARTWRYAYVTDFPTLAVAYADADGCRIEDLAIDPEPFAGLRPRDSMEPLHRASAKAIRMLGENGWEMVDEGPAYCHFRTSRAERAIHFKRAQ